jgi:carboxymethylenebutenolidase
MPDVNIPTARGDMPGYLARPSGQGPWPGVIVVHDVFGMTTDLRRQCDWLAEAGFLALGPNLYSWDRKFTCVRSTISDLKARRGRSFDDIEAARTWLVADAEQCSGPIGIIGYCMGGGFSLLLAPEGRYSASSVNYGQVPADASSVLEGACPVVASFGAKDRGLKGAAGTLEQALRANGVVSDVKEYPEAGHGFLNQHDGTVGVLVTVVGRLAGVGYHEPSAADARRRITAFFEEHLTPGAPEERQGATG